MKTISLWLWSISNANLFNGWLFRSALVDSWAPDLQADEDNSEAIYSARCYAIGNSGRNRC